MGLARPRQIKLNLFACCADDTCRRGAPGSPALGAELITARNVFRFPAIVKQNRRLMFEEAMSIPVQGHDRETLPAASPRLGDNLAGGDSGGSIGSAGAG